MTPEAGSAERANVDLDPDLRRAIEGGIPEEKAVDKGRPGPRPPTSRKDPNALRAGRILEVFNARKDLYARLATLREGKGTLALRIKRKFGFRPTEEDCTALANLIGPPTAGLGTGRGKKTLPPTSAAKPRRRSDLAAVDSPTAAAAAPRRAATTTAPSMRRSSMALEAEQFRADREAEELRRRPAAIRRRQELLDEILARRAEAGGMAVVAMLISSLEARALLVPADGQPVALELTEGEADFFAREQKRIARRKGVANPTPAFVLGENPWLTRKELNALIAQGHLTVRRRHQVTPKEATVILHREPLDKLTEGRVEHWRITGQWPKHNPSPKELGETRGRQTAGDGAGGTSSGAAKATPARK